MEQTKQALAFFEQAQLEDPHFNINRFGKEYAENLLRPGSFSEVTLDPQFAEQAQAILGILRRSKDRDLLMKPFQLVSN